MKLKEAHIKSFAETHGNFVFVAYKRTDLLIIIVIFEYSMYERAKCDRFVVSLLVRVRHALEK